jgi:GTPase Era involved in 16S rRNA processing
MNNGPTWVSAESAAAGELDEWAELTRAVEALSNGHGDLAKRAQRLAERIGTSRYHIAVLGDFKRGKSTLVNALVGLDVLPSGVLPLTTVATEVHIGSSETVVVFRDGSRREILTSTIGEYVTEPANPSNGKGVERVEAGVITDFGASGLVLVDTPGFSSVNDSNTKEARRAVLDADGAILVLAADNPLSKSERDVLELLATRRARVFLVINRCDALTPIELGEVRSFVDEHIGLVLGDSVRAFCVSARRAIHRLHGEVTDPIEFDELRAAIARFVEEDLAAARRDAVLAELERLGGDLKRILDLEEAADAIDMATLDEQIIELTRVVDQGRRLLAEDVLLLGHDAEAVLADVRHEFSERAASAARVRTPELAGIVAALPRGQLDRGARDAIEALTCSNFELIRAEMAEQVEVRWAALAGRFTDRVREHLDVVVEAGSDLFAIHLPKADVPALSTQRGRFSYYFFYAESQNAVLGRAFGRVVPSAIARRQTLRRATQRLAQEFEKHAGRARYDIAERLRAAKDELTTSMAAELEQTQASLLAACMQARAQRELGQAARTGRAELRTQLRLRLARVAEIVGGEQG